MLFGVSAVLFAILLWRLKTSYSSGNALPTRILLNEEDLQLMGDPEKKKSPVPSSVSSPPLSSVPSPATTAISSSVPLPAPSSVSSPTLSSVPLPVSWPTPSPVPKDDKLFLYLLETESCLPRYITPQNALGNEVACRCDVIVLSYKRKCHSPLPQKHMRYIEFNENFTKLTWAEGRNLLYETSQKIKVDYQYYIFLDDDAFLKSRANKPYNPWREFESFLLRVEPALGIADGSGNQRAPKALRRRKVLKCTLDYTPEYVPSPRFDACFNAFHRKAINYILPYVSAYDSQSWWFAARSVEAMSEIVFPGQILIHVDIYAMNLKHLP